MYNINNDIIVTIHKDEKDTINHIKNSPKFITSSYHHEYNTFVKYDYGPIDISNIIKFINFIDDIINNNKNKSKVIEYYVYETNKKYDLLNCFFLFGCYLIHKHIIPFLKYYLILHLFLTILLTIILIVLVMMVDMLLLLKIV